jgi:ribonuclease HI
LDPVFSGLGSLYSYPGSSLSSSVLVAAEGKCHDRVPLASPVPSLALFTDASLQGWGAYMEGQTVSWMWSSTLQKDHINLLEMRAVLLALSHFKLCLESLSIVLATDNTTVVAYLKNQGGTHC